MQGVEYSVVQVTIRIFKINIFKTQMLKNLFLENERSYNVLQSKLNTNVDLLSTELDSPIPSRVRLYKVLLLTDGRFEFARSHGHTCPYLC